MAALHALQLLVRVYSRREAARLTGVSSQTLNRYLSFSSLPDQRNSEKILGAFINTYATLVESLKNSNELESLLTAYALKIYYEVVSRKHSPDHVYTAVDPMLAAAYKASILLNARLELVYYSTGIPKHEHVVCSIAYCGDSGKVTCLPDAKPSTPLLVEPLLLDDCAWSNVVETVASNSLTTNIIVASRECRRYRRVIGGNIVDCIEI